MTKYYCEECGERIYSREVCEDDHGFIYCPYCFENYTVVDPVTGLRGQKRAHTPVYVIPSNQKFIEKYREAIYNSCRDFSQIIKQLYNHYNEKDIIAYLYDIDTETINKFVGSRDKLHYMEWKSYYFNEVDHKTYYVFIEDLIDENLKEEYLALWDLDEDDCKEALKAFEKTFHRIVETSVGADYSHLIPNYDNSECKETTSPSTNYTFKAMNVNENPEVVNNGFSF